jgi:hypothetical protein
MRTRPHTSDSKAETTTDEGEEDEMRKNTKV